jgi:glycogen(starch) synthase
VPSLWESFANVIVESMILGRPVVASRAGGPSEIVEDGRTGFLVPPGDREALATTMLEALSDGGRLRTIGESAARAAERFSIDMKVERMLALYERVAS